MEVDMFLKISCFLLFNFVFVSIIFADTPVPGGNVSGTWTVTGSPYNVQGNITIQADSTLTIEPGVEVIFQALYSLTVNGLLEAVGTETDSIHFFPADIGVSWWGILFENAPDSSHLAYCTVSYTGTFIFGYGGIRCINSNPVITHCRISNNYIRTASTYAGAIALNNSNAKISWCNISNNYSGNYGGGIYIYNSSPVITGCNISGNEVIQYGGGICIVGNSNPIITNCTIENNTSNIYGGGISALGSAATISECTVSYNHAETGGGGISIHSGSVFLDHCIIERNNCLYTAGNGKGGGIFTNGGMLTVDHCTFYENEISIDNPYGMEIHTEGNAAMTVTNSIFLSIWDFWTIVFNSTVPASVSYDDFKSEVVGSGTVRFTGNVPPGLGVLTQVNTNGDTCDVFYNIYLDPLFANGNGGDYHLTWTNWPTPDSIKSPCIDAGDPNFPLDPDNTISDMGALYFHQSPLIFASDSLLDFGIVDIGQQLDLPLTIRNNGTAALRLQNVSNIYSVFTHNWSIEDSLILPNDSLTISVTFTPTDTNLVADTLLIENNVKLFQVLLLGKGKIVSGIKDQSELPKAYALYPAYPNPFNPTTTIKFDLPKTSQVILAIYNILGEKVKTLVSDRLPAGTYKYQWDASQFASGIFLYQLRANKYVKTRKIILIK
jgi:parallel beta-helix repeat protein